MIAERSGGLILFIPRTGAGFEPNGRQQRMGAFSTSSFA